jgi:hypothetical protein
MNPQPKWPSDQMLDMISAFWIARAVYVAAKLGIADHLADEPRSAAELADRTGTHAPSLYRVLRALASVGVFSQRDDGRFDATPLSATLQTGVPGSIRAFAISELGGEHYTAWTDAMHSVKTGAIAFDHVFGESVWEYYAKHPDDAAIFNESMTGITRMVEAAVVGAYDFSPYNKVIDVGGGHGGLLSAILKANPHARGTLFDAPQVIQGAQFRLAEQGVAERCETRSGDFFQAVPEGGDLYVLKWIIHDWNDDQCRTILTNCRRAIGHAGKLLLVEAVIPPGDVPSFGKFIDLVMLVMTGGRERTESEFRDLLASAGFQLSRIVPTRSPSALIEAEPIPL